MDASITNHHSLFLDTYELNRQDINDCLFSGLNGLTYARRHFELSRINEYSPLSLWHKIIGAVEYIPLIGGAAALIEKIVAFVYSFFAAEHVSDHVPPASNNNAPEIAVIVDEDVPGQKDNGPEIAVVVEEDVPGLKDNDPEVAVVADANQRHISSSDDSRIAENVPQNDLHEPIWSNATAAEFATYLNAGNQGVKPLTEEEAQTILRRGGRLNIVTDEKIKEQKIFLSKSVPVIAGCSAGINRSQVTAAIIEQMGITINGVLAGGSCALNLEATYHMIDDPNDESAANFVKIFGRGKLTQVGSQLQQVVDNTPRDVANLNAARAYYQNFINDLPPTHFITFALSGPSVIRRLLAKNVSLEGFTITHFDWADEIARSPKGYESHSMDAYRAFGEKIRQCFIVAQPLHEASDEFVY